jgi:hypothetical protein
MSDQIKQDRHHVNQNAENIVLELQKLNTDKILPCIYTSVASTMVH